MKYIEIFVLILGLTFTSCNLHTPKSSKPDKQTETPDNSGVFQDKEEIQQLIRQVLSWGDSKESIDLLPVITDNKDSIFIGFDLDKLKLNLAKLRETNFFANEFIENYDHIILTLDRKLRNKEYEEWLVGDLPTFIFANDYSPWWNGQERFSIELGMVEQVNLEKDKGEFYFVCGDKGGGCDGLEKYKMRFRVTKEDRKWKISYLEGFDFKESTRADGQLL